MIYFNFKLWQMFYDNRPNYIIRNAIISMNNRIARIDNFSDISYRNIRLDFQNSACGFPNDLYITLNSSFCLGILLECNEVFLIRKEIFNLADSLLNVGEPNPNLIFHKQAFLLSRFVFLKPGCVSI